MTGRRMDKRWLLAWTVAVLAATVLLAACSPASSGTGAVADRPPTSAGGIGGSSSVQVTVPVNPTPDSPADPSAPASTGASTTGSTSLTEARPTAPGPVATTPVVPPAKVQVSLADGARGVSPVGPITVSAVGGTLTSVSLTSAAGVAIKGTLAADRKSWTVIPELGYAKTYTVTANAANAAGMATVHTSTFVTAAPVRQVAASAFPLTGMTVGVGQPVAIFFDEPVTDKAAVQRLISVRSSPKQDGAFRWFSNKEVHWRPAVYWKTGTEVAVEVKIYGKNLGGGLYGQQDKAFTFTIGRSMIAEIDDRNKIMVVRQNGKIVKQMPVSMGTTRYPTYNGVHVVSEKYADKTMDSSTWGLAGVGAYVTDVKWASRISSTGEFVHAAPWSVDSQGFENVSHGCVNVSTANAKWFYDNFTRGDIVSIKNTVGTPLQVWDGYGDWQLSFADYRKGSAV